MANTARRRDGSRDAVRARFELPFNERRQRAQEVHRTHRDPNAAHHEDDVDRLLGAPKAPRLPAVSG